MCDKNESPRNYKSTPPPTSKKVRNPFDRSLIERLHKPLCSPSMCKVYKKKHKGPFQWDIDQACTLVPADIVECNSQYEPSPDPQLEKIAEEATERFFSQEIVIPSPIESSKKVKPLLRTSFDSSLQITAETKATVFMKDVSAQTVLTLPPELPPELEKMLEPFCTFTYDQNVSGDYEITANGSLRRKLLFEEHSDIDHYDSEHTDDEVILEQGPPSSFEAHTPIIFSPDLSQDCLSKGMKRTFGTPLNKGPANKPCYRNKILDVVDFGEPCLSPIQFQTPQRGPELASSSSFASVSMSPVGKSISSDEEKNNFISPESEVMATCLNCITNEAGSDNNGPCFCKSTPNKSVLKRSTSLKESPPVGRKISVSFSEKRSLSMTSLNRSRSVQKLDFSMDMSIDASFQEHSQDVECSPIKASKSTWSIEEDNNIIQQLVATETIQADMKTTNTHLTLDETPLKAKLISNVLSHNISKIRSTIMFSPGKMSLDTSLMDNSENPLNLEDKKVDFNSVDLNFLTENVSQFDNTVSANVTKIAEETASFKRVDSGFNENTFYANASSYYESAIKPSELTITHMSKINHSKTAFKEISNVNWMRLDSGFKDENSGDSMQFYPTSETSSKITSFSFSNAKQQDKENLDREEFIRAPAKNEAMSMSDIFTDDMTFNCNFSSTPSKNKSRKTHT